MASNRQNSQNFIDVTIQFTHQNNMRTIIFTCVVTLLLGCSGRLEEQNAELKKENQRIQRESQSLQERAENSQQILVQLQKKQSETELAYKAEATLLRSELEDAKRRLEEIRSNKESELKSPGKFKVTLTYEHNKFIGHRGDAGASVFLDSLEDKRIRYETTAGGDGKAIINQVKPGKYLCFVSSVNALRSLASGEQAYAVVQSTSAKDIVSGEVSTALKKFVDMELGELLTQNLDKKRATFYLTKAVGSKSKALLVEILPNQETELSHDFGLAEH